MATIEDLSWRKSIIHQLHDRNKRQKCTFNDLIAQNNKLFDLANGPRSDSVQLNGGAGVSGLQVDSKQAERIQQLEQKLLTQQEELTELHRRKGDHVQQIIDLNAKLQEKEKALHSKEMSLSETVAANNSLKAEVRMLENNARELQNLNQMLRDEHQALQMAFNALEDKLRKAQDENSQLVARLIGYKAKDAEKMNEENDNFLKKRNAKMQRELEDACRDTRGVSPDELREGAGPVFFDSRVPTTARLKFDAHEGEVNAVKWSSERLLATGGADRKVKLWDVSKGTPDNRGTLQGSNAGVMSIDFDSTGALLLGASNDFASRVWTVADQRLKHTLTGHSGKVLAAKFLGESTKVVTGSHDRTLKIWDLRSRACIETKFAGSSCNDLVTADSGGSSIISGHFDKRIRFWDTRSESSANDIVLNGKVTSLDLSRDGKYLVTCVRDDTLKLLDLRKCQVVMTFSCEGFKVGCDFARATFSPDGQYVAVGSSDGSVYIWSVASSGVETILKEHTSHGLFSRSATTATAWCPYGHYLASVDRSRKVVVWGDH